MIVTDLPTVRRELSAMAVDSVANLVEITTEEMRAEVVAWGAARGYFIRPQSVAIREDFEAEAGPVLVAGWHPFPGDGVALDGGPADGEVLVVATRGDRWTLPPRIAIERKMEGPRQFPPLLPTTVNYDLVGIDSVHDRWVYRYAPGSTSGFPRSAASSV